MKQEVGWEWKWNGKQNIKTKRESEIKDSTRRDVPYRPADGESKLLGAVGPLDAPQSRSKPHEMCVALPAGLNSRADALPSRV